MTSFQHKQNNYTPTFVILAALFLMWGLITVMTGFLVPELMNAFELNYSERIIIALCFFGTYFFVAYPAGKLIDAVGFRKGIIIGVATAAMGCFLFYGAAEKISYGLSVASLFVLASGITILQVGANSYVVLVGRRGKGAQRLTFVQGFNALGTLAATVFAGSIIAGVDTSLDPESIRTAYAKMVQVPFLTFGGILLALAALIRFAKLPKVKTEGVEPLIKEKTPPRKAVSEFPHVALGCLAIFAYVGAEVTIFQFLLTKKSIAVNNEVLKEIDWMIKLYWGGLMIGRFAGAALLSFTSPRKMMVASSLAATFMVLMFIALSPTDALQNWSSALWMLTAAGLFNAVLFPCIFTMAMDGLGKFSEEASSVLVMSIGGGAVIPFLVFNLISEDPLSVKLAFSIVLLAYLFIVFFGIRGSRYEKRTNFY